jgi:hypothetical protein
MRRVMKIALATVALGFAVGATPAAAAVTVVGPTATARSCTAFSFSGATETACAGGYTGNLLQGSPETGTGLAALQALGYTGDGTFLDKLNTISGATIDFGTTLSGLTIIGLHYGAAGAGPEATSFFAFDAGAGTGSITVTGREGANALGLSNAVLFSTGAVPEPATWAMMLLGFGGIGMTMRRRRNPAMAQLA